MRVSIVIPALNAAPQLRRLLLCLQHSTVASKDMLQVVVVDDGSTDGTADLVLSFPARFDLRYAFVPRTTRSSRAAARNVGVAAADGDLVILVDADQIVAPTFVEEHLCYHRLRSDLVVIGPRVDLSGDDFDDTLLARNFTMAALPPVGRGDVRERLFEVFSANLNQLETCWHLMFTCNVSVRREHLQAVGGFDEEFKGWGLEDSDLGYRLRRRGLAFAFNAAAVTHHQKPRAISGRMFADWSRNLDHMIRKYNTGEVASQAIVGQVLDPADRSIGWIDAMCRFELAVRALAGRTKQPEIYQRIDVTAENVAAMSELIAERALRSDLIVLDDTADAALAGLVQCIETERELLYFHRPSREVQDRLREDHIIR
jgi:glycosyltransferase involved in cell wall biosynthesis